MRVSQTLFENWYAAMHEVVAIPIMLPQIQETVFKSFVVHCKVLVYI